MGLFNAIKQGIAGQDDGDIDLQISAPETVHPNDASIPVTAQITNRSQAPQTITEVYSSYWESENVSAGFNPDRMLNRNGKTQEYYRNDTAFTLSPGETKTLSITLPFNNAKLLQQILPTDNPAIQGVLGAISHVESLAESSSIGIRIYTVEVDLKIAGKSGVSRKTKVKFDRHNNDAPPAPIPPLNLPPVNPAAAQPVPPPAPSDPAAPNPQNPQQ